jgi:tRNA(Glu) U13 pseudouridine synthase TruD
VLTTLSYVAFVLVAVDAAKSWLPWDGAIRPASDIKRIVSRQNDFESGLDTYRSSISSPAEASSKVDDWLVKELQRAAESSAWQNLLAERLAAGLEKLPIEPTLSQTVERVLQSERMKQLISDQVASAMEPVSQKVSKTLSTSFLGEAQGAEAAVKRSIQGWLDSDEFRQMVTAAVQKSLTVVPKNNDATVSTGTNPTPGVAP